MPADEVLEKVGFPWDVNKTFVHHSYMCFTSTGISVGFHHPRFDFLSACEVLIQQPLE